MTIKEERFKPIAKIAEGGMAEIHLVYDKKRSEEVVLKKLLERHAHNRKIEKMFYKEARLVKRLDHPNILKIYEMGREDRRPYVVMEYFKSRPLRDLIKKSNSLDWSPALEILYQVGLALNYIHECGIIHLDLKPANILVEENFGVKLTDFGLATTFFLGKLRFTRHVGGTPSYMSPEQINGRQVDKRSDIYSFGVTAYETLTGRLPFAGDNLNELLAKHVSKLTPKPLSEFIKDIPASLDKIILKCLEKDRGNRYQEMAPLLADLSRLRLGIAQ